MIKQKDKLLAETLGREKSLAAQARELRLQNESLLAQLRQQPKITHWAPMPGHQFSAELVSLCCQLCLIAGFRAVPKILQCVSDSFGIPLKIPSHDVVRNWSCRNGVAILKEVQKRDDWVWMIDHSVQLGKMFVLVVLGIPKSQVLQGRPLRREDMSPLAVMPTKSRDKNEVSRQLDSVADKFGEPVAVLSDGATELHQGVRLMKTKDFEGIHLDDIKHKISNQLKNSLGKDEQFQRFSAQLGKTTAVIQQTELDHLVPPPRKVKCRFMSFDRLIDWATMVEDQLVRGRSEGGDSWNRLHEKLGWLEEYRKDLESWRECRCIVGTVLKYANTKGVFVGSTCLLKRQLIDHRSHSSLAVELRDKLLSFYQSNEDQLKGTKLAKSVIPCSTEVLESAFGSFKAMQGHHGRGTFTSLLASFPVLFDYCTAKKIRDRFRHTSNKSLKQWLKENGLTNSTQARRTQAYTQVKTMG